MTSITYRYAESANGGDPDNPPPLIICVDAMSAERIDDVVSFLCQNISLRMNFDGVETHLDARPVRIEIGSSISVSEEVFWTIQIESNDGSPNRVLEYFSAVVEYSKEDLPACTSFEVVGQHPIYAYLDLYLKPALIGFPSRPDSLISVLRAFTQYLTRSDIDHEARHFQYMDDSLEFLWHKDRRVFLDLFLFYLGTQADSVMSFWYLSKDGTLRTAVDHALTHHHSKGWSLRVHVLELCANVYGSNLELTEDVIAYCRMRQNIGDEHDLLNFSTRLTRTRQIHDATFGASNSSIGKIDTGFHTFDGRRWKRADKSLWTGPA